MEIISIQRVIGKQVRRLYSTKPVFEEGVMCSQGYVELADGLVFGLLDGSGRGVGELFAQNDITKLTPMNIGWPPELVFITGVVLNPRYFPNPVILFSDGNFFTNDATADRTFEPTLEPIEAWGSDCLEEREP